MDEERDPQKDSQEDSQAKPRATPEPAAVRSDASAPSKDPGWAGAPTSQVVRTVAAALLTAVVVLVALFILWKVRTFVGWFVIALFLAAVLNPAVNWLQRRHRLVRLDYWPSYSARCVEGLFSELRPYRGCLYLLDALS